MRTICEQDIHKSDELPVRPYSKRELAHGLRPRDQSASRPEPAWRNGCGINRSSDPGAWMIRATATEATGLHLPASGADLPLFGSSLRGDTATRRYRRAAMPVLASDNASTGVGLRR